MGLMRQHQALGLDIGQATVKAVLLARDGKVIRLAGFSVLDCRAEGILGQQELCNELGPWFEKNGWTHKEAVAGVPQYLASTQTSTFPPASDRSLDEMVGFETANLAGLSEEAFIFDYHQMALASGGNQVVIGICRESVIKDQARMLADAGVRVADFAISGIALAAACFHLYPSTCNSETPQLILDVGAENSTLVVAAGGAVLHTAALMFGTDRYFQLAETQMGIGREEVTRLAGDKGITGIDRNCPFVSAATPLLAEMQTALDNWRAQESGMVGKQQFSQVSLCGGGARVRGLGQHLGKHFGCPSQIVGVPDPEQEGAVNPLLMTAYGLALQGVEGSLLPVSLAPPAVRWHARRRRRFPALATAATLLVVLVILAEARMYFQLGQQEQRLTERLNEIKKCDLVLPGLEQTISAIDFHQRLLVPFVEKGNHARRFAMAIKELDQARDKMIESLRGKVPESPEGWVIYLADNQSFQIGKSAAEERPRSGANGTGFGPLLTPLGAAAGAVPQEALRKKLLVTDTEPWTGLVAAVYTATEPNEPYRLVRRFVSELNDSALFKNVDLMPEPESAGREDIFLPWTEVPESLIPAAYRRFVLRLPFETQIVHLQQKSTP